MGNGKADDIADITGVDTGHNCGNKRHTQVVLRAVFDRLFFDIEQSPPAQGAVNRVTGPVKLHENKGQAGLGQGTDIFFVCGKPDAVCV